MKYLSTNNVFNFIVNDFESAWDAIALDQNAKGRGNFMFTMQAMVLLEFGARLCVEDKSGKALSDWSECLFSLRPAYATEVSGDIRKIKDFDLPYKNSKGNELLWFLWDLVRNGHVHHYHQIIAILNDGVSWEIAISGADVGLTIAEVRLDNENLFHLGFQRNVDKGVLLTLCPAMLFLDIKDSILNSGILNRELNIQWLNRQYKFDSDSLDLSLNSGKLYRYL